VKRKWWVVGILVFLELLVCGGILLTLWIGRATFEGVRFFYLTDVHIEETVEKAFTVDGPAVLDLDADFSDVTVTGGDTDEIAVIARLSLWGSSEEDARQQVDVQMTQEGNRVIVRVERPERIYAFVINSRSSHVDFEIRVPSATSLQLVTSSGDLAVRDVAGAAELETSFGSVEVERVDGPVSAWSSSGDITLIGLSNAGDLEVETEFGSLVLRDVAANSLAGRSGSGDVEVDGCVVDGLLDLQTEFGSVTAEHVVADRVVARSGSGEIRIEEAGLSGPLDLETNFGDVTAVGVDAVSYRLKSGSGSLTLDCRSSGDVELESDSGDLTLYGCSGFLDLQTEFGDIEVRNAADAQLMLKTSSGGVTFSGGIRAAGEHRVESEFGDVHVVLPTDAAFDLDAETEFGSIETDFAVTVSEFEEKHIVGEVNGGGPSLVVRTNSGSVTLEGIPAKGD
jgi:DUF4097 and DUF4098 domain-containing protein YvlB